MAAADDDDAWLYGADGEGKENLTNGLKSDVLPETINGTGDGVEQSIESGQEPTEEAPDVPGDTPTEAAPAAEEEDSDSDDDDDVQVTIGEIKTGATVYDPTQRTFFKGQPGTYQKAPTAPPVKAGPPVKGVDVDAEGVINGVPTTEFDIDTLAVNEKPWRQPGADITDYFNYGFNEETWVKYCAKQNHLREQNPGPRTHHTPYASSLVKVEREFPYYNRDSSHAYSNRVGQSPSGNTYSFTSRNRPPPANVRNTINVIGSTAKDSRRQTTIVDLTHGPESNFHGPFDEPPPGMEAIHSMAPPLHGIPDFTLPPPGLPHDMVPNMPPPDIQMVPPPGFPPPEVQQPPPQQFVETFYAPVPPPGDRQYSDQAGSFPQFDPNYGVPPAFAPPTTQAWEPGPRDGYTPAGGYSDYNRRSSPSRSDGGGSDGEYPNRYGRGSDRETYYDRESSGTNYRDRRERSRSRDRDKRYRDRDREREKDRDKDRDRSSTRRKHREEEESDHKSKHKKSKRSKRDKDDEGGEPSPPEEVAIKQEPI